MKPLHCLIFVTLIATTGCSGLFEEFPEYESQTTRDGLRIEEAPPAEVGAGEDFDLVLRLIDGRGDAVEIEGVPVDLKLSEGEFVAGGNELRASSDETGKIEFSITIATASQDLVLTATSEHEAFADASVSTAPFAVVAGPAQAAQSRISGEIDVDADGELIATVTIELIDEFGNGVAGVTPEFEATGEGNDYQACSATDDNGLATCLMTSTVYEEKTLKITDPVQVTGESIEFLRSCDDSAAFGGGEGTEQNPYLICTPDHLNQISAGTNAMNSHFLVVRDLDMVQTNNFNIIGDNGEPFVGRFDGGGFTIRNLGIEYLVEDNVGIFGEVGAGAVLEDIVLENATVAGNDAVGGLVGINEGTIRNCSATVKVTGHAEGNVLLNPSGGVGGLVGTNRGAITNCTVDVEVESGSDRVGGLAGSNSGEIFASVATGTVDGARATGGLVGLNVGDIEDSSADVSVIGIRFVGGLVGQNGDLINNSHAAGAVEGDEEVGGLVGRVFYNPDQVSDQKTMITNSYATGNVTGSLKVGGLIGKPVGHIEDSYATGNVEGIFNVGGLIGEYHDLPSDDPWSLRRCYATGSVSPSSSANPNAEVGNFGGLIGSSQLVGIESSYATGDVTGIFNAGGLVGRFNSGRIANSYATGSVEADDTDTGQAPSIGGLVGRLIANDGSSQVRNAIFTSYAAGAVTGPANANSGGLFGIVEGTEQETPNFNACYWDPDTTGLDNGVGVGSASDINPVINDDFDEPSAFGNSWDFTGVWAIGEAPDGERRPILQWQNP